MDPFRKKIVDFHEIQNPESTISDLTHFWTKGPHSLENTFPLPFPKVVGLVKYCRTVYLGPNFQKDCIMV